MRLELRSNHWIFIKTITYCCTGNQEPVSVEIQSDEIAGCTAAAAVSEQLLDVMLAGHQYSEAHLRGRMAGLLTAQNLSGLEFCYPEVEGVVAFVRDADSEI